MPEWALAKKEVVNNEKADIPYGFFGCDQKAAFDARQHLHDSFVVQR